MRKYIRAHRRRCNYGSTIVKPHVRNYDFKKEKENAMMLKQASLLNAQTKITELLQQQTGDPDNFSPLDHSKLTDWQMYSAGVADQINQMKRDIAKPEERLEKIYGKKLEVSQADKEKLMAILNKKYKK